MRNALKILIVDDDRTHAQALAEVIKKMGWKPVVTFRPPDALNVVRLQTVHAALVDVMLPKMNGVDLVAEFRKTKFGDNPVVFISGVFKDKAFTTETLRKTGAVDFLYKPFTIDEVVTQLSKVLSPLFNTEKWSVQSLLTRKLSSDRERAKAIENLENVKGLDFPFVLSILMEVGSSGNLNIIGDNGEIFGVNLNKGAIADVDSADSQSNAIMALINNGFLNQEDWESYQSHGHQKLTLEKLVQDGLISPHAVSSARNEQIKQDLRSICVAENLQINFVPQEEGEPLPEHAVDLRQLTAMLEESMSEIFADTYLRQFYEPVWAAPARLANEAVGSSEIWQARILNELPMIRKTVDDSATFETAVLSHAALSAEIYRGVHYLVLNRCIMFDDVNRAKTLNNMLDRYKKLYEGLKNKSPDKIFEYFGAKVNSPSAAITTIYEEYARSNNPDHLGKDATPELRDLCKRCLDLVQGAYEVMSDETKRSQIQEKIKQDEIEKKKQGQVLAGEAFDMLKFGRHKDALSKLREAEALASSGRTTSLLVWAEVKSAIAIPLSKQRLQELSEVLNKLTNEEKKGSLYFMALGLVKKAQGDSSAITFFERAVQVDSEFAEARRELSQLQKVDSNEKKKLDILNGDITAVVSQLFRRKAE